MDDDDMDSISQAIRLAEAGVDSGMHPPIEAGKAPGGLVFQTWADGVMLSESCVVDGPATGKKGARDGELAAKALKEGREVLLKCFDGDTGIWVSTSYLE